MIDELSSEDEKKKWLFKENVRLQELSRNLEDERKLIEIQMGMLQRQQSKNMLLKKQLESQRDLFEQKWNILERETRQLAIDKDKLNNVEDSIKNSDSSVDTVEIEVDCRIIKITMNFIDNTTSDSAKQLATNALHTLDDALGNEKSNEESQYSDLLGMANGRGQYNVEFVLTSNGDSNFPIFGTKHPSSDEISFTGTNVVDQETTDQVLKKDSTQ